MNLIEQLGGYKKAKAELKDKQWRKDNLHGSDEFTWHIKQHIQLLEAVLLQYRREHNIFEVGDDVVHADFVSIGKFISYTGKSGTLCFITYGLGEIIALNKTIRHATPEEIQAGRRLDQIKCWSCDKTMTHKQRSENDGFCIHCNAEVCGG